MIASSESLVTQPAGMKPIYNLWKNEFNSKPTNLEPNSDVSQAVEREKKSSESLSNPSKNDVTEVETIDLTINENSKSRALLSLLLTPTNQEFQTYKQMFGQTSANFQNKDPTTKANEQVFCQITDNTSVKNDNGGLNLSPMQSSVEDRLSNSDAIHTNEHDKTFVTDTEVSPECAETETSELVQPAKRFKREPSFNENVASGSNLDHDVQDLFELPETTEDVYVCTNCDPIKVLLNTDRLEEHCRVF